MDPIFSYLYFRGPNPSRSFSLRARAGPVALLRWPSRESAFGSRIMRRSLREAVARGDRSVLLEVFEHIAPALDLYTRLGFSPLRKELPRRVHDDGRRAGTADAISDLDSLDLAKRHRRQTPHALKRVFIQHHKMLRFASRCAYSNGQKH